jgi:hypothetical protein
MKKRQLVMHRMQNLLQNLDAHVRRLLNLSPLLMRPWLMHNQPMNHRHQCGRHARADLPSQSSIQHQQ